MSTLHASACRIPKLTDTFCPHLLPNPFMKNLCSLTLSLIALLIASPCEAGLAGFLTREHQPWSFIQEVGGMKVSTKGHRLLVECDVSGLKTVTIKPTLMNSAMGVRGIKCSRVASILQLSVVTSVLEKGMSSECGTLDLSAHPPGSYSVVYLDPNGTTHPVGMIVLP